MSDTVTPRSPLVDEVLSGKSRDLQLLAAQGILPLAQEELIALQVELAGRADEDVARAARQSLDSIDALSAKEYLKEGAPADVLSWFAQNTKSPPLLEVILQRRDLPVALACEIAPRLSAEMQEILLLRQDLIVEHSEILEALETNASLSSFAKRRIAEYRRHLVETAPPEPEVVEEAEELEGEFSIEDDPELMQAIEQVKESVSSDGEFDQSTGLTESQIRALPPPLRAKLARGASRSLRLILIRDPNPTVAKSVLSGSAITESEIELVSTNRSVTEEVLAAISRNREWMRKYTIVHNLAKNPRTPVGVAIRLQGRLSVRDLSMLAKDRNVSDPVRQNARRMLAAKRK